MATKVSDVKLSARDQEVLICALLCAKEGVDTVKVIPPIPVPFRPQRYSPWNHQY